MTCVEDVPVSLRPTTDERIAASSTTVLRRLTNCVPRREETFNAGKGKSLAAGTHLQRVQAAAKIAIGHFRQQRQILAVCSETFLVTDFAEARHEHGVGGWCEADNLGERAQRTEDGRVPAVKCTSVRGIDTRSTRSVQIVTYADDRSQKRSILLALA